MMQLEASPRDRVRVIGALTGAALKTLFEMVKTTEVRLDLSQVSEADAEALQLLARLAPERCDRFASPKWLALRIEMERRSPRGRP
jgi:ABC-type transporter Mla MlaB component